MRDILTSSRMSERQPSYVVQVALAVDRDGAEPYAARSGHHRGCHSL
jgi:hypothetical protein